MSPFHFKGHRCIFSILFNFSMNILKANRIAPDGTPRFAASHLGLFCLPMSHKKDARLIWVNSSKKKHATCIGSLLSRSIKGYTTICP